MDVEGCPLPDDLLYDLELSVWLRYDLPDRPGVLRLGLMAHLSSFAGRISSIRFREIADEVRRTQSLATVESPRYTGALRMPLDGRVVARNPAVVATPKLLNNDPYGKGWVADVEPVPGAELPSTLRTADAVREDLLRQIREMHIRCYPAVPDAELYEIGSECSAVFAHLDDELARRGPEDVVLLVADDPTAPIEMERWRTRTGHRVLDHRKEGELHHYLIRKT